MRTIRIENAYEGNLQHVSLEIPRNQFVVFTGVSGSGKSTLVMDVLFHECQRQYLEALSMEGIHKPKVERISGASPAIAITQTDSGRNPRSTVGTVSDLYTDLRMVYEKLGTRSCPFCGELIHAADCKEETEKRGDEFFVYMYCSSCGKRMDKLTRTSFSFNTKEGACKTCQGLGSIHGIDQGLAVRQELTLEEGAVAYWEKQYGAYQLGILYKAYEYYGLEIPKGMPMEKMDSLHKTILLEGVLSPEVENAFPGRKPPKTAGEGRFEGAYPILMRRYLDKNGEGSQLEQFFKIENCPDCKGERLAEEARKVTVFGKRLPELSDYSMERLLGWVKEIHSSLEGTKLTAVEAYLRDLETKLQRFIRVGLGYLSLNRQTITLSGGEHQRLKLAALLDCDLSGVIYILDEPTRGLHPKDTEGLVSILHRLKDLGNTVLVIEHDPEVMAAADYLVDIGPGAGRHGGQVTAAGSFGEVLASAASATARWLLEDHTPLFQTREPQKGWIRIKEADKFNLKKVNVEIPIGCLTAVTGPSGSGKSTLIFEVLAKCNGAGSAEGGSVIDGLEHFEQIIEIGQSSIARMKRSNIATFTEVYTEIRGLFAGLPEAKKAGLTARHFSFNVTGGRCENCEGLGYVDSNMLFFTNVEIECPVCRGRQFGEEVLSITYKGLSIHDVLKLTVGEALEFFRENKKISRILQLLMDVGLEYPELGQTLTTLSGGEGQRLKLARELSGNRKQSESLYLMDEPTTGLHPRDVEHFLILLKRLTDAGNTVVVVEHNQQLIRECDWVVDLGPEGGEKGGFVTFTGTPEEMQKVNPYLLKEKTERNKQKQV